MKTNIIYPLFKNTPFDFFNYERYYYNGDYINPYALCSIPWTNQDAEIFFKKNLLPSLDELHANQSHYAFLSPALPLPEAALQRKKFIENMEILKLYGVHHRLCLVFNQSEYVEVFVFGLRRPLQTVNVFEIFMSHTAFLEKFCVYLRETSQKLISNAEEQKMVFEQCTNTQLFNDLNFKNNVNYKDFLEDLKLDNYFLRGRKQSGSLSKRQFECLFWCAQGKTSKQIGRILSLSPRTVEEYLNNIKSKLGCETKIKLIDIALKNPIIKSLTD